MNRRHVALPNHLTLRVRAASFALALTLLMTACKRDAPAVLPPVPVLVDIRVSGNPNLTEDLVRRTVAERTKLTMPTTVPSNAEPYRLRVRGVSLTDDNVVIEIKLEESKLGGRKLEQTGSYGSKSTPRAAANMTEHLLGDMLADLDGRLRLYYDPPATVMATLMLPTTQKETRLEAAAACAERRLHECVDGLLPQLRSDDEELRDAAIGALSAIGDRRAVRPLTEIAHFSDLEELPKVLEAVTTIGGPEARSYLEFIANGHDRAEVRALAHGQLDRLDKKAN